MGSIDITGAIVFGVLALVSGFLLTAISSNGVAPPYVPDGSPTLLFPPWYIFKPIVALNDLFSSLVKTTTPPPVQVLHLATAYWMSEVTYALTKNGIIDAVGNAGKNGSSCEDIATNLDLTPFVVCEYMKAATKLGLLSSSSEDNYTLTPTGELLQTSAPGSLRDFTLMINEEGAKAYRSAGTKSISTARSGAVEAFGKDIWSWYKEHPEEEARFDRAMQDLGFQTIGAILNDWTPHSAAKTFCDVGGGIGTATSIILQHYPDMNGIVFDRPHVVDRAKEFLGENGLRDRVNTVGGDFFQPFPSELVNCDVFFLKHILHDWGDTECMAILKNIREVANQTDAKIMIVEHILETSGPGMELDKILMSINMIGTNSYGARERSHHQYKKLLVNSGIIKEPKLILTRDIISIIEVDIL